MLASTQHHNQQRRGVPLSLTGIGLAAGLLLLLGATAGHPQPSTDPITTNQISMVVTVTHAYALCLIDTATLPRQQAMATADDFLSDQGISPAQRMAIRRSAEFYDLLQAYIQQRGGCRQLVRELMK